MYTILLSDPPQPLLFAPKLADAAGMVCWDRQLRRAVGPQLKQRRLSRCSTFPSTFMLNTCNTNSPVAIPFLNCNTKRYPIFANRLGIQHGWNLFYVGVWSMLCLIPILTKDRHAWFWGLHQYLFDWGYFMAIDWVHRGGAFGAAQTFIVSIGLFCRAWSVKHVHGAAVSDAEHAICLAVPSLLFVMGLFNFVREKTYKTCMDCQLSQEEEDAIVVEK